MIGQSMSNANGNGIPELSIKVGLSPRRDLMTIVSDHDHEEFINVLRLRPACILMHEEKLPENFRRFSTGTIISIRIMILRSEVAG